VALETVQAFIFNKLEVVVVATHQAREEGSREPDSVVWDILEEVDREHPVSAEPPAPSSPSGIQAFEPVVIRR